jgi:1,4-dihydroxy-2-naphthoyl-CoA synthase
MGIAGWFERRSLLKAAAAMGGVATLGKSATAEAADEHAAETKMADVPLSPTAKITVERRGQIVLIGINRPYIHNRVDPETYVGLAKALYQYDHDPSLRAAVLFGHGEVFSRGIDVDAYQAFLATGRALFADKDIIDPLAKSSTKLTKPLIVVTHGDTWNMAHELCLVSDIRVAAADTASARTRTPTAGFRVAARPSASCTRPAGAMPCATC